MNLTIIIITTHKQTKTWQLTGRYSMQCDHKNVYLGRWFTSETRQPYPEKSTMGVAFNYKGFSTVLDVGETITPPKDIAFCLPSWMVIIRRPIANQSSCTSHQFYRMSTMELCKFG